MTPFINIIQFVADKNNFTLPDNFLIYFDDFFTETTQLSDMNIFKCYIYIQTEVYTKNELEKLTNIYIQSKNIKNVLKTYIRKRRIKKMKIFDSNTDLYFNSLDKYPKNQLVKLIINNTIYNFRISNLINMWLDSLTKQENLFCKPIDLKNPYTNLPFQKHNLYNIFFAIHFSPYIIPTLIHYFFLVDFNLDIFVFKYYPVLKDYAIKNFISNGSVSELYENIHNMLYTFKTHLGGIYLPHRLAYSRKKFIVKELTPYLKDFLVSEYSCNPFRKRIAYNKSKEGLSIYFRENELVYVRREPEEHPINNDNITTTYIPPPPPHPIIIENHSTNNVTSPRPNRTQRDNIRSLLQINSSLRRNIITQMAENEVFRPQTELPRTPTTNNPQNTQTQSVRPFSLNLFSNR